jgi:hypothetical protein
MKRFAPSALLALTLSVPPVHAEQGAEQGFARREMRAGNVRSLRDIERRVLPTMPGMQYLGPEYDPAAMVYRLKFIRDGRVVFVDVDARSGAIIGQSR